MSTFKHIFSIIFLLSMSVFIIMQWVEGTSILELFEANNKYALTLISSSVVLALLCNVNVVIVPSRAVIYFLLGLLTVGKIVMDLVYRDILPSIPSQADIDFTVNPSLLWLFGSILILTAIFDRIISKFN